MHLVLWSGEKLGSGGGVPWPHPSQSRTSFNTESRLSLREGTSAIAYMRRAKGSDERFENVSRRDDHRFPVTLGYQTAISRDRADQHAQAG